SAAENFARVEHRQRVLKAAFMPFDTYVFQKKLDIERHASQLLEDKLKWLLNEYFRYNIDEETSPLVKEAAMLLPFISQYRGDFGLVSNLLQTLVKCSVVMSKGRYSEADNTVCWLPYIRYLLMIPDLTAEEYREKSRQIEPLAQFIKEWLIPFDVHCEIVVKEHRENQPVGNRLTLGYNTKL
nr:hypothetical protein [Bacteroidales bacterium]